MPEHFHLLMSEPQLGDPSRAMQSVKQRFAQRVVPRRRRRLPAPGTERSLGSAANTRPLQKTQGAGHPNPTSRPAPVGKPQPLWQPRFYDFNVWTAIATFCGCA